MARVAATPLPVLVVGESGVGKELVARALHTLSGRTGSLVDINCPAIPEAMLESDLFGCRRGAFTGAEDRAGLVVSAHGGTLFLDEVGDLPLTLQAKLLRFLETGSYRRVGGARSHTVDIRLVSATNAPLTSGGGQHVRNDLYHRIAGVTLTLPPLRERPEDVELLVEHALAEVTARSGLRIRVDDAALQRLLAHPWPGNVRELRHVVQSLAWSIDGDRIRAAHLPEEFGRRASGSEDTMELSVDAVRAAFRASGGRLAGAARELGLSRQQLYRRLDDLGLDRERLRQEP
jgi:DNA-binding NtrC family response regulator